MEKGLVFDIKRFAVHDGAGIRTTVFFKGCGMRCRWCQNPEGLTQMRQVIWLEHQCTHCASCRDSAEEGQLEFADGSPKLNRKYSGSFDNLIHACPSGAIRYDSTWYTAEELIKEIEKDRVFYRGSGGVTFSGGEPLLHGDFLIECLKRCRERGINTAIESALYADNKIVQAAAQYLDAWIVDYKCSDDRLHQRITGADPSLIKTNLAWILHNADVPVTVRTPLIPGYTADVENIRGIASFIAAHNPDVNYELLNYNELAPAKYEMTGRVYEPGERSRFSETEMEQFRIAARSAGLMHVI